MTITHRPMRFTPFPQALGLVALVIFSTLGAEGAPPVELKADPQGATHNVSLQLIEGDVLRVETTGTDPYFVFPSLSPALDTADYTGLELECRSAGKPVSTRVEFFFGPPFQAKRRASQTIACGKEFTRVLIRLKGNAPQWSGTFSDVRFDPAAEAGFHLEFRNIRLVHIGPALEKEMGERVAEAASRDGRAFGLNPKSFQMPQPTVQTLLAREAASTTVVASYSPDVDLDAATKARESETNQISFAPPLVCGQGPDPLNFTVIRLLTRHGIPELQMLAYPPAVRGGVDVAAGWAASCGSFFAAAPLLDTKVRAVRVFSRYGALLSEIAIPESVSPPFCIATGDANGDGSSEVLVSARQKQQEKQVVLCFDANGKHVGSAALEGVAPGQREASLSFQGGQGAYFLARDRQMFYFDFKTGKSRSEQLTDLREASRAYLGADGQTLYAAGDEPVLSTLHIKSQGKVSPLNAGARENLFWLGPQRAWGVKKVTSIHADTTISGEMFQSGKYLPKGRFNMCRVYSLHDYRDTRVETPRDYSAVTQGPELSRFTREELAAYRTQAPAVWEPTFTTRYGNWEATSNLVMPGTRLPKYMLLDRRNEVPIYTEGGRSSALGTYSYWENPGLYQACIWPVKYFLNELCKRQRQDPEYFIGVEPNHEMEIACDRPDSVGDYNPYSLRGFYSYLMHRYGSLAAVNRVFGTPFTDDFFDAPRDFARGPWDAYAEENLFFRAWFEYSAHTINRVLCDTQREALLAGFPPETVSSHQIPDLYAIGDPAAFASTATRRITPIDWLFTSGCGFGFTRYGLWVQKPHDALSSGYSSGFAMQTLGEYAPKCKSPDDAFEQYKALWGGGAYFIHLMAWDPARWPGENEAAFTSWNRFVSENDRPRPGVAGGIQKIVPPTAGRTYALVSLGTGPQRNGLIKSLAADGTWEGSVYTVPFHSLIQITPLPVAPTITAASPAALCTLTNLCGGTQLELVFTANPAEAGEITLTPSGLGGPQPQLAAPLSVRAGFGQYRLVYRFPERSEPLTMLLSSPKPLRLDQVQATLHQDGAAQTRMGKPAGERGRGGVCFDVLR